MLTRGSKTAAEKVVRESESPNMGSPDKRESISPVTDVEESPLFKYLCNLSPIKPAKAVHHAQTYNELTFPPEPRIFASPRSSRRSSNSSLKRCERVVAAELSAQAQAEGRESLGWHATNSRSTISDNAPSPSPLNRDQQVTPCSRRQTEEVPASQSNSAKNDNDAFTVEDLVGQGMFAMNPMNPESSERTAATAASFQTQFTDFEQLDPATIVECLDGIVEKAGGTSTDVVERRQSTSSSLSQDCVLPENLTQESKCLEQNDHRHNEEHGLNFSKGTSELDHDTTAMAYFLAGNEALGQDKGEWSEDSSDLLALNEEAKQEADLLDAMASQSGLDLATQNRHNDGATENANHQHSLLSHRADIAGQRGFRRRCLDFDASGARRKSLSSMGSRKSLGSRLKDCSGTTAADGNNASPILDNVIPATSDATASTPVDISSSNANDTSRAEPNSGTHTTGTPACGDALGAMAKTRQQLPTCSYENNVDVLNAKTGEANPQQPQNSGVNPPAEGVRRSPRVRRTGIGLHLNSLTTSMSFKRDYSSTGGESAKRVLATSLGLQPLASVTPKEDSAGGAGHPNQSLNQGVPSLLERRSQIEINNTDAAAILGNETVDIPTPNFRSLNIENLPPLKESLALTPIPNLPRLVSPRGQKRSHPHQQELIQQEGEEVADDLLESPQSSKRRRLSRRKSTAASQGEKPGDGCKRCNCKKSKCLKLYCECFAAGIYCVGSCACRHCFNKPEYEDTVRNTRLQIESRNPLAFAPKIVQAAEASPIPGDEALDTPASARHKRGCNCKKSLCLKKYCECFQAGVGCSEGCRCEGCKNMYGKKEGPAEGEEKEGEQVISSREESQLEDPIELLNRMNRNSDRLQDCAKPNLSPITPSFEHDGHGRSMLRFRSTGRKRISSDEHCTSPLAPHVSKPPKSPTSFSNTLDSFDLVPHPPEGDTDFSMNGAGESPMTTPTFARVGHVSSRWEGLTDLCTLTPLPSTTTLQPTPGSSCVTTERPGASPAFSSQRTESPHHAVSSASAHHRTSSRTWSPHSPRFRQPAPRSPLRFDTPRQSSFACSDQQLTPSMQSSQISGGKSLQSELESAKVGAPDDDSTPDFLKCHADEMSSPSRSTVTTKSSSPKQKRVTPPRHGDRELQGGIIPSSPGFRNSKRFILQALPPVTPSFPNG